MEWAMNAVVPMFDLLKMEAFIHRSLEEQFGEAYHNVVLKNWTIVLMDEERLHIQVSSAFCRRIILSRMLPAITVVVYHTYGLNPAISVGITI